MILKYIMLSNNMYNIKYNCIYIYIDIHVHVCVCACVYLLPSSSVPSFVPICYKSQAFYCIQLRQVYDAHIDHED